MLGVTEIFPILLIIGVMLFLSEKKILKKAQTGDAFFKKLKEKELIVSKVNERFERIIDQFRGIESLKSLKLNAYVLKERGVNAMILPSGHMFFTRDFIRFVAEEKFSDDEIAGVVAHEIAHLANGHAMRSAIRLIRMNRMHIIIFTFINLLNPIGRWKIKIMDHVTKIVSELVKFKYSRQEEFEADRYGTLFLSKTSFSNDGLIMALEKLQKIDSVQQIDYWMSTHPPTSDRITKLKHYVSDLKPPRI